MSAASAKILHVVGDSAFTAAAIREFEAVAPGRNEYLTIDSPSDQPFKRHDSVREVSQEEFRDEVRRPEVRGVIFHSLPTWRRQLLRDIPGGRTVVWIGWGHDYYSELLGTTHTENLVMPMTSGLTQQDDGSRTITKTPVSLSGRARTIYWWLRREVGKVARRTGVMAPHHRLKTLRRVDIFSPVLDSEYELVRAANPWLTPAYLPWNYLTLEDDMPVLPLAEESPAVDLLAGNSAIPTNNHAELFDAITRHVDLTGRRVYVPLGYGDARYRDSVLRLGESILGDHFAPLTDYLPLDEYARLVSSCGFVLMYQLRQQALGNICMAALGGAKIFLHPRNPLAGWLAARGVTIGDVTQPDMTPLTPSQRRQGRDAIESHWGRTASRERTSRLVERVISGK